MGKGEPQGEPISVTEASRSLSVDFWNTILVPKFSKYKHIIVGGLSRHSAKIFASLRVKEGDHVVDIGCGFGDTAIELARRVGPKGSVLGIDCCKPFLEYGRRDARDANISNIEFVEGDVQVYPFEPVHDFCFSRFGTQFFDNPVAALRNMRRSLKPEGLMTMVVWRTIDDNPWLGVPKRVVLNYLPPVKEGVPTCGPGPFSMADPEVVTLQLKAAGYEDIEFERVDAGLMVGRDVDDAMEFQLALGPAGEVFREAGAEAERHYEAIASALKSELSRYQTAEGIIMGSSSWKVTAHNPGPASGIA
jgi:ubiquinone/menaquinone biosynthesis C-methylase UbiE